MKQNLIFAFILLATLSMVNAIPHQLYKKSTKFEECPNVGDAVLNVSLSPDPVVAGQPDSLNVYGKLEKELTFFHKLVIEFADIDGTPVKDPIVVDICSKEGATCPPVI